MNILIGIQNFLQIINDNWTTIIVIIGLIVAIVKKAKDYLEFMSFSREGLYEQLAYEGFTDEQIQYGLSQVGY